MAEPIETPVRLFNQGRFLDVVRNFHRVERDWRTIDPLERAIISNALSLTGELEEAESLALSELASSSSLVAKSYCHSALATVSRFRGRLSDAISQAHDAVQKALDSKDYERIAWARLHLFRLLIEVSPGETAPAALTEVRRAVARAGQSHCSSYLHACVAVLEGQTGHINEARRHCDIAESLLDHAPNIWLTCVCLINRGCIAALSCDFKKATDYFRHARDRAEESGHAYLLHAAGGSLGHVQLLSGHFEKSVDTLSSVLTSPVASRLGVSDTLARAYLALNKLHDVDKVLSNVQLLTAGRHPRSTYHARWFGITEARLMLKRGMPGDALSVLLPTLHQARTSNDMPLEAIAELVSAEASSRLGDSENSAMHLVAAAKLRTATTPELRGQYDYGAALILGAGSRSLQRQLFNRATRLWRDSGIVSVPYEMDSHFEPQAEDSFEDDCNTASSDVLTNSLATLGELAHRPRILGEELLSIIKVLKCSPEAKVVKGNAKIKSQESWVNLPLNIPNDTNWALICRVPETPEKALLLSDVLSIARSALELEGFRHEERNRAAVWPAAPVDEQAGALFVADEMQALIRTARRIADTNVPVLITGETGTGKEVLARAIHAYSSRSAGVFLPFNCGGVPKEMLDSQLFGHRRGAFTGAVDSFRGVIRAGAGGTLFLDEVGETTLDVQPKLLRFLEAGEVHPIGETQPVQVDVRVIAATNADLDDLVAHGRFREDLYYRLNILRLHIPPLRDRRIEIPVLANYYLRKHASEYNKGNLRIAEETMEYLVLFSWPGNVRQLANEMRRLAVLAESDAVLMPEHLSADVAKSRRTVPVSERSLDPTEIVVRLDQPLAAAVQHIECAFIQHALEKCGGRVDKTAAMLGLSRKGLYLKRRRFRLGSSTSDRQTDVA